MCVCCVVCCVWRVCWVLACVVSCCAVCWCVLCCGTLLCVVFIFFAGCGDVNTIPNPSPDTTFVCLARRNDRSAVYVLFASRSYLQRFGVGVAMDGTYCFFSGGLSRPEEYHRCRAAHLVSPAWPWIALCDALCAVSPCHALPCLASPLIVHENP